MSSKPGQNYYASPPTPLLQEAGLERCWPHALGPGPAPAKAHCLVCNLKRGYLDFLNHHGGHAVAGFEHAPSDHALRALAELIHEGLVRDFEQDGRTWFCITANGAKRA